MLNRTFNAARRECFHARIGATAAQQLFSDLTEPGRKVAR
jgi:hypothetical protein